MGVLVLYKSFSLLLSNYLPSCYLIFVKSKIFFIIIINVCNPQSNFIVIRVKSGIKQQRVVISIKEYRLLLLLDKVLAMQAKSSKIDKVVKQLTDLEIPENRPLLKICVDEVKRAFMAEEIKASSAYAFIESMKCSTEDEKIRYQEVIKDMCGESCVLDYEFKIYSLEEESQDLFGQHITPAYPRSKWGGCLLKALCIIEKVFKDGKIKQSVKEEIHEGISDIILFERMFPVKLL